MRNEGLLADFRRALSDFSPQDNVGSPYCVRRYVVDEHLGGPEGLATARRHLSQRGLRLILDFVPNHVAPDHPWVSDHPEYFIQGSAEDARNDPASFIECGGTVFACGRDPYFPAWPDVLQLNAFHARAPAGGDRDGLGDRRPVRRHPLRHGHARAERHLRAHVGWPRRIQTRVNDYWTTVIPAIKGRHPEFRFIAEAYWDLEWELQQQGFDFCYDKKLYDRMEHGPAENVRLHLLADLALPGGHGPVHREPRRTQGRGRVSRRKRPRGGSGDSHAARGPAAARRTVRGMASEAAGLPGPPPGRAGRS